ncbi:MAG TPA: carboxypeptidase-like regulatory domain-containing protein, partial [Pyrinomonadaceae bacterium]|nr:carboxypeptidase-like regulatory domain-containing protein [Pyrinomonadaceae bacterium]
MRRLSFLGGSAACVFGALLFALLLAGSAFAQTGTSSVRGTATDPQGNLVAGATVTLSNTEKNFTRTQVTGEDGGYVFTAVPPGTYKLEIEAPGFKKVAIENVTALVDTPVTQDAKLEVGGANETVTITSQTEAPLNTTDATIGNAI